MQQPIDKRYEPDSDVFFTKQITRKDAGWILAIRSDLKTSQWKSDEFSDQQTTRDPSLPLSSPEGWLVVWNMIFFFYGNFIIPIDVKSIIFQGGRAQPRAQPPARGWWMKNLMITTKWGPLDS